MSDTIAAIASPDGGGERGIVRLSGPATRAIVLAAWSGAPPDLSRRRFALGRIDDGAGTQPAMLVWMPGPRSFTREDVAELHVCGSPPLVAAAFARVVALGARPARPGEFTRRAFESGRIDLSRAEGVLALVRATNASQARAALRLVTGGVDDRVTRAREALDTARALVEASLDFSEDDTGDVPRAQIEAELAASAREVELALDLARGTERSTLGARIALAGAPNAGKSSLYNALAGRAAALVSDVAGTTRDALVARLDLGGIACELVDTPGVDPLARALDAAAQELGAAHRAGADAWVWVQDASRADDEALAEAADALRSAPRALLAWSQIDRPAAPREPPPSWRALAGAGWTAVSARTGAGVDRLRALLRGLCEAGTGTPLGEVATRHRAGLEAARVELERARASLASGTALELVAEDLRQASAGLDDVSGTTTPEDLLDRIFARFCLGK